MRIGVVLMSRRSNRQRAEKLLDLVDEAQTKRRPIGREAKKYFACARECVRQADEATSAERRDKLLELARVWMVAALTEGNIAVPTASPERGIARRLSS